jgi:RNA methyltransferase, TrmH family
MEVINSLKNEHIQMARDLNSQKGRNSINKILLEGEEIISWAIHYDLTIDFIITSRDDISHITAKLKNQVLTFKTTEGLMKKITDTNYLVPVIAVGRAKKACKTNDFILILDNVKDFGNIGTIVRTANAFGIKKVISTRKNFDLYQKKTIESSRGTVFGTKCSCFTNPEETIKYLQENNYQIVTTSPHGREIQSLVNLTDQPIALVVGNETDGASKVFMENSDVIIQIPMQENVESLNVGVATGISVYELKLKQVIKMIEDRIKSTLGRELNVASMLVCEALDKALKKVSFLSSHQLVFMMVLKCDKKMSKRKIEKQFGVLDIEFNVFIKPLINNGFIIDMSDSCYSITEKGIETVGKLWTTVENTENAILSGFTEDEKETLFKMLERIRNNSSSLS